MNIDWSKAPEGCLEVGKNQWDELAWLCADGYIYLHCNGCMVNWNTPRALTRSDFHVFDIRPEDEWTGEGCRLLGRCEYQTWVNREWKQTKVLAHHLGFAVHSWSVDGDDMEVDAAPPQDFRPIRTPEQIAAEEREKAAQELFELLNPEGKWHKFDDNGKDRYRAAVDLGYRKQVQP